MKCNDTLKIADLVSNKKPKPQFAPAPTKSTLTEIKLISANAPNLGTPSRVRKVDPEPRVSKSTRTLEEVDDREEIQFQFRKNARSNPAVVHSPKIPKKLLNAYGVPISTLAAAQPKPVPKVPTDLADRIKVCVRKRPLSNKEIKRGDFDVAEITGRRTIGLLEPKLKVDLTKYVETHTFNFDEAFGTEQSNEEVYKRTAFPLVNYIFEGGKATCFA